MLTDFNQPTNRHSPIRTDGILDTVNTAMQEKNTLHSTSYHTPHIHDDAIVIVNPVTTLLYALPFHLAEVASLILCPNHARVSSQFLNAFGLGWDLAFHISGYSMVWSPKNCNELFEDLDLNLIILNRRARVVYRCEFTS